MKVIRIAFFVLNIFISNIYSIENWDRINQVIQIERDYLLNVKTNCLNRIAANTDSIILKYFEKKEPINTISELNEIVSFLRNVGCCKSKYYMYVLDEKIFLMILNMLEVVEDSRTIYDIYEYIYFKRNIKYLKKYSKKINKVIEEKPCGELTLMIMLMCGIADSEKEKFKEQLGIFYKDKTPYYIDIRLGDKKIEDKLLEMYQDEKSFNNLKEIIKQLELAGTEKCEMALVNSLGTKNIVQESSHYGYSIKFFIIEALGRLHPDVTLLNDDFQDYIHAIEDHPTNKVKNTQITKEFYEKLYLWVNQKYDIKLEELRNADYLYSYELERYYDED